MGNTTGGAGGYKPGRAVTTAINAPAGGGQILPRDERRRAVILPQPPTHNITYSWAQNPVIGVGLNIATNQPPVILDRETYGALVTQEIFAVSAVADQVIGITEEVEA